MMNYIPLEKKRKSNFDINSPPKKGRRMKPLSFGGDSRILHRIKALMVPSFIDEDQLLSDLQDTYPEYRRKKRGCLRAAIKKAIELFAVDGDDSNEGDSDQSFVNDVESTPDERYVEYEDARFSKRTKLKKNEEYLQAKGAVSTQNDKIGNDASDSNVCCSVLYAVDKSPIILKKTTQESNMKDARFSKRTKLKKNEEYLQAKGAFSTQNDKIGNDASDSNVCCSEMYAVDKSPIILKKTTQESNMKNSNEQKSKKIPTSLKKQGSKGPILQYPEVAFADIGGHDIMLWKLYDSVLPLRYPKCSVPGVKKFPRSFLLHGPPGCGKTLLAHAIAGEFEVPLIEVTAANLISAISGETEKKVCKFFKLAVNSAPCVLFFDEIDAIASKTEFTSKGMENRLVSQLLKSMGDLKTQHVGSRVLVIGATNKPDALHPAFRRGGRFGKEIFMDIPDETTRISILQVVFKDLWLSPDFDLTWLAKRTPGYSGSDLAELVAEADDNACNRLIKKLCVIFESSSVVQKRLLHLMEKAGLQVNNITEVPKEVFSIEKVDLVKLKVFVSMSDSEADPLIEELTKEFYFIAEDFQAAVDNYVPCCKKEGFATVPSVPWNRVGGLKEVQKEIQNSILEPLKYKEFYDTLGYTPGSGMLLWGPKGCGKTLLAKAVASECGINFIPVKGPELLNMYVGESEKAIRKVFQRARDAAPCVILFDEIDSVCPPRSNSSGNAAADRVVTQLLAEMDGVGPKTNIFVIGTTNRLENIDSAMLRPGRLGKRLYVGLPSPEERVDILKSLTKNGTEPKLADDVNLEILGRDSRCDGFSGADLKCLVKEATEKAVADLGIGNITGINIRYFDLAFTNVRPSVSEKERKYFERLKSSEERRG